MFHTAAGTVYGSAMTEVDGAPITKCINFHCDNIMQDDKKAQECCPGAVALQPPTQLQIMVCNFKNNHASLFPSPIRHSPDVLLRPPKFYPFLAG
jgi:hypothetical protein